MQYTNGIEILSELHIKNRGLRLDMFTPITPTNKPGVPNKQYVYEGVPDIINGEALQKWVIADKPLNEFQNDKKQAALDVFTKAIEEIKSGYSADEISSWDQQKLEAEAYVADNTVVTPLLSKIATARGITVDLLATSIMVKVSAFQDAFGTALGEKQKTEDAIQLIMQDTSTTYQAKIDALDLL